PYPHGKRNHGLFDKTVASRDGDGPGKRGSACTSVNGDIPHSCAYDQGKSLPCGAAYNLNFFATVSLFRGGFRVPPSSGRMILAANLNRSPVPGSSWGRAARRFRREVPGGQMNCPYGHGAMTRGHKNWVCEECGHRVPLSPGDAGPPDAREAIWSA